MHLSMTYTDRTLGEEIKTRLSKKINEMYYINSINNKKYNYKRKAF